MKAKRRELTSEERAEAMRLKGVWEAYKHSHKGATQEWLGKESGLGGQSVIAQYLNGVIPMNLEALLALCGPIQGKPEEISPRLTKSIDFFYRSGDRVGVIEMKTASGAGLTDQISSVLIQQYDAGGSMGGGVDLPDQPGIIQNIKVSREWLESNVRSCTSPKNLCIVTGFGDSMRPLFNPGDPLILDRGVVGVEVDAVYFFRIGKEGFIKRLQRVPGNGLIAISENKAYKEWTITEDMDFEVFGRILKAWKSEDL
jgi:phage repressor protein C with HTH and peptisase S24 domain